MVHFGPWSGRGHAPCDGQHLIIMFWPLAGHPVGALSKATQKNLNNAALTKILDGACMAFGPDFIAGILRIARP